MSSSSSVQQAQFLCATSNSFEGHKSSSSSSTTARRRESSTRRSLLLRVSVHRQSQFTHQQLLQYAGFLPRVHRIETEAAIRALGECKLSCVVPLSVCVYCLPLVVCLWETVELISSEANRNCTRCMRDAVRPHRDFYVMKVHDLEGSFSAVPGGHTEKLWR